MNRREFHSHTGLSSDGTWAPLEMIRCARDRRQTSIALTDHVGVSNVESILEALKREREAAKAWTDIEVFIGVEITHVPTLLIAGVVQRARRAGAEVILVHGETLAEPVEPGTNRAALNCPDVDVLAHPGLLSVEEAQLAARNGIYLEISARRGHCLTNGHVTQMAEPVGALLIVNTDAHEPTDLINVETSLKIARGAGLSETEAQRVVGENTEALVQKIRKRAI